MKPAPSFLAEYFYSLVVNSKDAIISQFSKAKCVHKCLVFQKKKETVKSWQFDGKRAGACVPTVVSVPR